MKTFAVLNQKGGTGKTTVTLNLSAQLVACGKRVLVIDVDPQGNTTSASGVDKAGLNAGIYEVLHGGSIADNLFCSLAGGYHILPANSRLAGAEVELAGSDDWQSRLRDALTALRAMPPLPLPAMSSAAAGSNGNKKPKPTKKSGAFDFIFIDCPPSLGILTVNALTAADLVLIPMQCEYFALEGLTDLADTVRRLRQGLNPKLAVAGIIRSMLDSRNLLAQQVSDELHTHFGDKVFSAVIPRNVRVAEAPSHQLPLCHYAPQSTGAAGYRELCEEFLRRYP